jgi:acetolactate synthase-1/2/3 large subunit
VSSPAHSGVARRGADVLAHALAAAGVRHLFSLSGNQIMPVYDAALEARLSIVHVRHEGAAVHMADAWGRLTGEPGIALVTGGPGHANAVGALYTALAAESPLVLLSGHAPLSELGRGAFQEMAQADLAGPVTKGSWTAKNPATLGEDMARALELASSGRPGPVHVSLPFDVLEAKVGDGPGAGKAFSGPLLPPAQPLPDSAVDAVLAEVSRARRPIVLVGPVMAGGRGRATRERLAAALNVPVICMESPRGVNDPCLGAFAEVLREADLLVLLGKQPDFTLRFGAPPAVAKNCRFVVIDPEPDALQRGVATLDPGRVTFSAVAEPVAAAEALHARTRRTVSGPWQAEVDAAVKFRPAEWRTLAANSGAPLHPVEVGRAVRDPRPLARPRARRGRRGIRAMGAGVRECNHASHQRTRRLHRLRDTLRACRPCGAARCDRGGHAR